jgi:tetratricopeptide (TPR) repeat protein
MKHLIIPILLFLTIKVSAVDTTYYAVLRSSLQLADQEYSITTFRNLANTCDRIIALKDDQWLPLYYRAYAYVHLGYMTADEEEKDRLLDEAQASADAAGKLDPEESENQLLYALICYGRMEINPMARATIYFPRAGKALERAKELDPENPRIYYLEGKSITFKPVFMGGGPEAALPVLEKALTYYSEFVAPYDIYPHWGQDETLELYRECQRRIAEN